MAIFVKTMVFLNQSLVRASMFSCDPWRWRTTHGCPRFFLRLVHPGSNFTGYNVYPQLGCWHPATCGRSVASSPAKTCCIHNILITQSEQKKSHGTMKISPGFQDRIPAPVVHRTEETDVTDHDSHDSESHSCLAPSAGEIPANGGVFLIGKIIEHRGLSSRV